MSEKKKEILLDAAILDKEQQTILRNHFERNHMQSQQSCMRSQQSCISESKKCKNQAVKDVIQLFYKKGLFDSFESKDQISESYLVFSDEYLLEKLRNRNTNIRWWVLFIRLGLFNARRYPEVFEKR